MAVKIKTILFSRMQRAAALAAVAVAAAAPVAYGQPAGPSVSVPGVKEPVEIVRDKYSHLGYVDHRDSLPRFPPLSFVQRLPAERCRT